MNATKLNLFSKMLSNITRNIISKANLSKASLLNVNKTLTQTTVFLSDNSASENKNETEAEQPPKPIDPAEFKALEEKLKKAETDVSELKDKYVRALAETENVRNRMIKGIEDAKTFGIQGFCKDLLEVADILNMAVVNTNPEKEEKSDKPLTQKEVDEKLSAMYNGLVMTEKCMLKIFEKNNLIQIKPAEGDKFDPNFHDAIFRVPIPGQTSGTINVVTKTGFQLKERVIRAAQVGVVQ